MGKPKKLKDLTPTQAECLRIIEECNGIQSSI
jgi:hypothetical protein